MAASCAQLRPGPPPDYNSAEMAAQVSQLNFARTTTSNTAVYHWASVFVYGLWGDIDQKVFANGLATNPPRAARAYALSSVAQYDALIACWDSKPASPGPDCGSCTNLRMSLALGSCGLASRAVAQNVYGGCNSAARRTS